MYEQDYEKEVLTTLPLRSSLAVNPIVTERLILRRLMLTDFPEFFIMRQEPEMEEAFCPPFASQEKCYSHFCFLLGLNADGSEDNENFHLTFGIFLKTSDGNEGELIGQGGADYIQGNWPSVSYAIKKAHTSRGYGKQFLKAFFEVWRGLARGEVQITLPADDFSLRCLDQEQQIPVVKEVLLGSALKVNIASIKVLQSAGFLFFEEDEDYVRFYRDVNL